MAAPWTKRYAPKKLSEVVGQLTSLRELVSFVNTFPRQKAALVFGPTGVGKTAAIHALANDLSYEIIELNASDKRSKNSIEETLLPASQQASLFGSKKLIVIDEADSLSGTQDRGGAPAIAEVIKQTKFPIVLTANDLSSGKLKSLLKVCKIIQFNPLDTKVMLQRLKSICENERISYEDSALEKLASLARGDMRAAINDLEMIGESGKIGSKTLKLWGRLQDDTIHNSLRLIFKSCDSDAAFNSVDNITEDYDTLKLWIDENLSKEYSGKSLSRAYECLSCADIFGERIHRWQHWRFLVYIRSLLVSGVQHSKEKASLLANKYVQPSLLLKLWMRNARDKKLAAEAEQLCGEMHASTRRLKQSFFPYWDFIRKD